MVTFIMGLLIVVTIISGILASGKIAYKNKSNN